MSTMSNHGNHQEWVHLKTGKEFSRLLYPNPVCFLSTIGTCPFSSSLAAEQAVPDATCDSVITGTSEASDNKRCKHPEGEMAKGNVMVLSWLTPTNNQGRFMFSINESRYSTELLCHSRDAENDQTSNYQTEIEFALSVPVQGMENLVLDAGSISGRVRSKFPSLVDSTNDSTRELHEIAPATNLSNRQRKKQRKQQLSLHGVTGLIPVPLGSYFPLAESEISPSSMFAIKGTVAHLHCRTYAIIGTHTVGERALENNGKKKDGECVRAHPPIIDDNHLLVMAEVVNAYVHPSYWDDKKLLFRPLSQEDVPPYLTFFGSQTFGYVMPGNKESM